MTQRAVASSNTRARLVEVEVKRIQALVGIAEAGLRDAALEQAVLPAQQLVAHEVGEKVERDEAVGLRFEQARFETGGHAGAAELAQGALQFEERHGAAPALSRATTSR